MTHKCPECGTAWSDGKTCQDHFHQMLFWEAENPGYGEVHHLMVLCYHLQHPSLYSPRGLSAARRLLVEFLEQGETPDEVRKRNCASVDSGKRKWKIKGTAASHGSYDLSVQWTMMAADVTAGARRTIVTTCGDGHSQFIRCSNQLEITRLPAIPFAIR